VAWSYDLLGPQEQELFGAVALFQSGFRAEAAGDLVGWDAADATDVLSRLVERSLLHRSGSAATGCWRASATSAPPAWTSAALTTELRRRHALHHVAFAEACCGRLRRPGQVDVFDELDASLPDLRAAQRHLREAGDHDALLRLVLALRDYGYYRLRPEVLRWARGGRRAGGAGRGRPAGGGRLRHRRPRGVAPRRARPRRGAGAARPRRHGRVRASGPNYLLAILAFQALHRGDLAASQAWADVGLRSDEGDQDVVHRIESHGGRALVRAYAGDPRTAADVAGLLASLDEGTPEVPAAWAWYVAGESVIHDDPRWPPSGSAGRWRRPGAAAPRSCSASRAPRPPRSRPATAIPPRRWPSIAGCWTTGSGRASG
jgi:hypothetical protein